jgi:hypothetical protein
LHDLTEAGEALASKIPMGQRLMLFDGDQYEFLMVELTHVPSLFSSVVDDSDLRGMRRSDGL